MKFAKPDLVLIVSPNELNQHLRTVIIAPMTTGGQAYPWRVRCHFRDRAGFVALDQLRTVDNERLVRRLGRISPGTLTAISLCLAGNVRAIIRSVPRHSHHR